LDEQHFLLLEDCRPPTLVVLTCASASPKFPQRRLGALGQHNLLFLALIQQVWLL
jgi:hypothetical protein